MKKAVLLLCVLALVGCGVRQTSYRFYVASCSPGYCVAIDDPWPNTAYIGTPYSTPTEAQAVAEKMNDAMNGHLR